MILEIEDLHTFIGEFHILQGVSLKVAEEGATVILGRNGAGKTTTLRTVMGFYRPWRGKIAFCGEVISGLPPHEVARRGIGYVPEDHGIFGGLTVAENLRLALRGRGKNGRLEKVLALFPDLEAAWQKKAGSLSGGQKQMLAIGRALLTESRLLLVDEPSKGLAPVVVENVARALKEIKKTTTVVLVEQNFQMARAVGDSFFVLDDGCTVWSGTGQEMAAAAGLLKKYLGIAL